MSDNVRKAAELGEELRQLLIAQAKARLELASQEGKALYEEHLAEMEEEFERMRNERE